MTLTSRRLPAGLLLLALLALAGCHKDEERRIDGTAERAGRELD